jgi:hypothetical protein
LPLFTELPTKSLPGNVYIFLNEEDIKGAPYEHSTDAVVPRLEREVEFLRQELATRDAEIQHWDGVLLSLSEGLKALNPLPLEARESPVSHSDDTDKGNPQSNKSPHSAARGGGSSSSALESPNFRKV